MRIYFFVMAFLSLATAAGWAQNTASSSSQPPPGTISSGQTNAGGSLTFTNGSGTTFTVEQLGAQLQALRATVEQTLPMLTSFNEHYTASQPGSRLGQAIQNIFSGNKNQNQTGNTAGREVTNVLSALGALVSTNGAPGTSAVNPNTVRDLVTLQKDLQQVQNVMQGLSLAAGSNENPNVPTPTGR